MNILFFNACHDARLFGVERWMLNLARALHERGHAIGFAAPPESALLRAAQEHGLRALPLPVTGFFPTAACLRALLRKHAVQACCVYTFPEVRLAALARLGLPVRLLMRRGTMGDVRDCWSERWLLRVSGATIVTGSQALKKDFCSVGWLASERVAVLPHGLDAAAYANVQPAAGLPPASVRVVYAGRLHAEKGTDVLLEAWRLVHQAEPEARLLFVGATADERHSALLKKIGIADVCDFAGYADDIKPWLATGDLFVLSSPQEGASYALLQAQAAGLPVVATRGGGNPELTRENETALLVLSNDAPALAAALLELIRQPERRKQMGVAARAFVAENFSWDVAVQKFLAVADSGFPSIGK